MGNAARRNAPPLNEPVFVPEVFITGLADFEESAGVVRAAFYAEKNLLICGGDATPIYPRERVVVARYVCPSSSLRSMMWEVVERMEPDPMLRAAVQRALAGAH